MLHVRQSQRLTLEHKPRSTVRREEERRSENLISPDRKALRTWEQVFSGCKEVKPLCLCTEKLQSECISKVSKLHQMHRTSDFKALKQRNGQLGTMGYHRTYASIESQFLKKVNSHGIPQLGTIDHAPILFDYMGGDRCCSFPCLFYKSIFPQSSHQIKD